MLAIDTETTGADLRHGCKPFYVSTFDGKRSQSWEWDVRPKTREPIIPKKELREIRDLIMEACEGFEDTLDGVHQPDGPGLVFHNSKFDVLALERVGLDIPELVGWECIHDTHIAHHVVASEGPHGLKDLAILYLGVSVRDEKRLEEAVEEARRYATKVNNRLVKRDHKPLYAIADKKGHPHYPAQKRAPDSGWKVMDYWLPRAICIQEQRPESDPWYDILSIYADRDAERTWDLWQMFAEEIVDIEALHHYGVRRDLLEITYSMESRGVTVSEKTVNLTKQKLAKKLKTSDRWLTKEGLENPNSPQQVLSWFSSRGCHLENTKKETLEDIRDQDEDHSEAAIHMLNWRALGKAVQYVDSYQDFAHMCGLPGYWSIHPTFNICGTKETRFSSKNPNAQNISKQETANLRSLFSPLPGRSWIAIDYENVEMRIFAAATGEPEVVAVYERGDSFHSLVCQLLYPDLWSECERKGLKFKEVYKATLYQWVKNGNFSLIYGAGKKRADKTYHYPGAYDKIRRKFKHIDSFMRSKNAEARRNGFIVTEGGYRLEVPEGAPHKAVNYYVQGTAGWLMCLAMVNCYQYLQTQADSFMVMQVHDEIVFDVPSKRAKSMARKLSDLMEAPGASLGLVTPVEATLINDNWAKGVALAQAV